MFHLDLLGYQQKILTETESWKNLPHKQLHNLMQVLQIFKLSFFEVINDDFS